MASAASNLLNLLTLGSGRIKDNEEFGVEVTPDGIRSTGDRYKQSGLGSFISRLGGDKTAGDLNRELENALLQADIDRQIQAMQAQAQAQSQQDLARLNNSLMGQRELDAYTRNREATKEDQEFDKQAAEEAALRQFLLAEKAKESDLGRLPFVTAATEEGLTFEEANDPDFRSLKLQTAKSGLGLKNTKNMSDTRNRVILDSLGDRAVNIRGLGAIPLGAAQGLGAGALNLYENPEDQELRRQLLQAEIARQKLLGQPKPMDLYVQALLNGGIQPVFFNDNGKQGVLIGTDVKFFNNAEDRLKYLRERE